MARSLTLGEIVEIIIDERYATRDNDGVRAYVRDMIKEIAERAIFLSKEQR